MTVGDETVLDGPVVIDPDLGPKTRMPSSEGGVLLNRMQRPSMSISST